MPTILRDSGYRFFFYSNERLEPPHIHISGHGGEAKFWLPSCQLARSYNLNAAQLRDIFDIIIENRDMLAEGWHEFFNSGAG